MRVSLEWLREYVSFQLNAAELAEKLTMSGIAVEAIEDQAEQYRDMIVAQVVQLSKHEQADNLLIVKVATDQGQQQVITAAKNLKTGDLVPLALPGATLPDGKEITEVNFKGVLSQGMLCSGAELGLEKESSGIWVFESGFVPGTPVAEALGATDQILVLELTANRSDCLGMIGVAREVAAVLGGEMVPSSTTVKEEGTPVEGRLSIEIRDPDLCPRYIGRIVTGVKIEPSPQWMQRRLQAAGVRPINNVVDITNYIMLEYNQPLHAFDYDRIAEHAIIVRRALDGEKLLTLDDVERQLEAGELLIADPRGPLCVAGVMGGASSEVRSNTVNILFEAAYFAPRSIRKTASKLGMKTESSFRFERGIDPNGTLTAMNRAMHLIELLGAGTVAKGYIDQYPQSIEPVTIHTSAKAINQWLGTALSPAEIRNYLERVRFSVLEPQAGQFEVTVPTYRPDVSFTADLAEEVARLYGYDLIPATIPESRQPGGLTPLQRFEVECRSCLQGIGLSEIKTYSLYAKNVSERLQLPGNDPLSRTVDLLVPLSEEQAVMRTNLIHSMLECMAFNAKRRQSNLAFFELARIYRPKSGEILPEEPLHLSVGLMGQLRENGWNQSRAEVDFYDLKGILEALFARLHLPQITLERSAQPFLHPGQAAEILVEGTSVGWFGQVHPDVAAEYGLTKKAFVMELDLSLLAPLRESEIVFEALPKFPALERDLALVLPKAVPAAEVAAKIETITKHLVERVELFDVYQGEQVPEGMRSLAFKLVYRSKERTLTDVEVNQLQTELLTALNQAYGAMVRA
jgi:phenylalanyl-tRNA synthetase beta chain